MITFFFLILFGTIVLGFFLYHFVFSDDGRKGKSGKSAPPQGPTTDRATGPD